jgi:hypothetical protein
MPIRRSSGAKTLPAIIAALHQGNYATIPNYLNRELRYMDAGEQGPKALAGPQGTPGYQ